MSRTKRFTKDEIDVLSKSPYVKNIRENRLSFTYDFRCILYDEWIKYPSVAQIRKALMLHNFNCTMIGCDVINRLHRNFKRDGRPTGGKNKTFGIRYSLEEKYDNEFFICLGINLKIKFIKMKKLEVQKGAKPLSPNIKDYCVAIILAFC